MLSPLVSLLAAATAALATGVIVPLYVWPEGTNCGVWGPLFDVISAHPSTLFYIIINPDSGPVVSPDPVFQTCIPRLKAASSQVITVGYVRTGYGSQSDSTVNDAVQQYANWGSAWRPQGIFFDEVEPSADLLPTYTAWANNARAAFSGGHVVLNPGATVGSQTGYFNIADLIITAENLYSDFSPSQLTFSSSSPASKQGVILTDAPSSPPASLINSLVGTDGLGSLYITDDSQLNGANPYDTLPTQFSTFVSLVDADS
ncbi:hypothetical protein BDW22DRAFT_518571 [Trametopsis cervina]|nr:hypothetical protein BDW22DRAFT_518571 [Trametopsis cervina]